jgi:hypothetical protein
MSFFGNQEDAIKFANKACHVIDGEDTTSPVLMGGAPTVEATGGASFDYGTTQFQNVRDHGRSVDAQGHKPVRMYGMPNATKYK